VLFTAEISEEYIQLIHQSLFQALLMIIRLPRGLPLCRSPCCGWRGLRARM